MMWFFAALIVLAMGGIAAVAAGYGQPARQEYDDRVDTLVPAGRIGAEDLRRVRFPLGLRGYRMAEVDALLDRLAAQIDSDSAPADAVTDRGDATPTLREGPPFEE